MQVLCEYCKNIYKIFLIDNQPTWATQQLYEEGRPGNKNKRIELMTEYGTVISLFTLENIFIVSLWNSGKQYASSLCCAFMFDSQKQVTSEFSFLFLPKSLKAIKNGSLTYSLWSGFLVKNHYSFIFFIEENFSNSLRETKRTCIIYFYQPVHVPKMSSSFQSWKLFFAKKKVMEFCSHNWDTFLLRSIKL